MSERYGCGLCGAVHFTLTREPLAPRICWCRDCQHLAANGSVNLMVDSDALQITGEVAGYVKTADSGNRITRQFCPVCGTQLFARSSARPQFAVVRAGNLDELSSIQPTMNIWADSAPAWACLDPVPERIERQPVPPQAAAVIGRS